MRRGWIPEQGIELDQGHRRDRVFGERLDSLPEAPQLVSARAVEVTAQLRVAIPFFYVGGEVRRDSHPLIAQTVLKRTHRRPKGPHLVAELTAGAFGMGHAVPSPVRALEQRVEKLRSDLALFGFQIGDRERGVPRRVDAAGDVRRRAMRSLLRVPRVVVPV